MVLARTVRVEPTLAVRVWREPLAEGFVPVDTGGLRLAREHSGTVYRTVPYRRRLPSEAGHIPDDAEYAFHGVCFMTNRNFQCLGHSSVLDKRCEWYMHANCPLSTSTYD